MLRMEYNLSFPENELRASSAANMPSVSLFAKPNELLPTFLIYFVND